jgi:Tol biopolymer transport system component
MAWLSDSELLMTRRIAGSSDVELFTLAVADGAEKALTEVPEMRGVALSPDKRYLVYYTSFQPEAEEDGVWLLDLQNAQVPQKLPFFGAYRWRDGERLIYVPFDPDATEHNFYEYDTRTGQTRSFFPAGTGLTIANNDWQVSPDGSRIALVAANGMALDGIWVLDIGRDAQLAADASRFGQEYARGGRGGR